MSESTELENIHDVCNQIGTKYSLADLMKLIERGTNVNLRNANNLTPLMSCVMNLSCSLDVVKYLLDAGAEINAIDDRNQTALFKAIEVNQSLEIIKLLINQGADPNRKDYDNLVPLFLSVGQGRVLITECLLENGADPHAVDCYGRTPLFHAIGTDAVTSLALINCLLDNGAMINCQDYNGHTVLTLALWALRKNRNYFNVVTTLINYGADIYLVNNKDKIIMSELEMNQDNRKIMDLAMKINYQKHVYRSVVKSVPKFCSKFINRPSSLKIRLLGLKWSMHNYEKIYHEKKDLLDYLGVTDVSSFQIKIMDLFRYAD